MMRRLSAFLVVLWAACLFASPSVAVPPSWSSGVLSGHTRVLAPPTLSFIAATSYQSTGTGSQNINVAALGIHTGDMVLMQMYGFAVATMAASETGSGNAFTLLTPPGAINTSWDNISSSNRIRYACHVWDSTSDTGITITGHDAFGGDGIYVIRGGATSCVTHAIQDYDNTGLAVTTTTGFTASGSTKGAFFLGMSRRTSLSISSLTNGFTVVSNGLTGWTAGTVFAATNFSGYSSGSVVGTWNTAPNTDITILIDLQ